METVSEIVAGRINKLSTLDNVHPMTFHSFVREGLYGREAGATTKARTAEITSVFYIEKHICCIWSWLLLRNNIDVSMDVHILCGWLTV